MHLYQTEELLKFGFASVAKNVKIDSSVRFFGANNIHLGNNIRIDPFCILSAGENGIYIGNNVHIAAYCLLVGTGRIELEEFAGLSGRVSVYSSTDDYTGGAMTNPTVPKEFTNVTSQPVTLKKHAIVGAGSVILPGVTLGIAAAVGALTVIRKDVGDFSIVAGNPARQTGFRDRSILDKEAEYRKHQEINTLHG